MPELPDILAYTHALEPRILGQTLEHVRIANPFLLRTTLPTVADVEGRTVREIRRVFDENLEKDATDTQIASD